MADSNITKKALAESLKEIMKTVPFDKITVAQICDGCDMNRKSFYYHFKDKYDLVNWIFDTEFIKVASERSSKETYEERMESIENICEYFYNNREFYQKALLIKGQNSFSDYLRQCLHPLLRKRLTYMFDGENVDDFTVDLFADFTLCVIERWLLENDDITPKIFVNKLHTIICRSTVSVYNEIENN